MDSHVMLVAVIVVALLFDFTNGFHDTANSIATMVGTRAVPPLIAVTLAATLNFVGAFWSLSVAATVGHGIVIPHAITLNVVVAGLVGAIAWNLVTWRVGIPSSSSHALIGGLIGATIASAGLHAVLWGGVIGKVGIPAILSPALGLVIAGALMAMLMRMFFRSNPRRANRGFKIAQIASGGWLSFAHGTGDAQKTMGIIALALLLGPHHGAQPVFNVPIWVIFAAASSMALGTYAGGWRIIRTLGSRIVKMEPMQGFAASMSSAAILFFAAHQGFPVSTTHVVSGSVLGAGASKRVSAVRWGIAIDIVTAWVITLPSAAIVGAIALGLASVSPILLFGVVVALALGLYLRRPAARIGAHAEGVNAPTQISIP